MKQSTQATIRELLLSALPGTQAELCAKLGKPQSTISRWLVFLHGCREIHVGDWRDAVRYGLPCAVYHAGPGADVLCTIRALPAAEVARRAPKPAKPRVAKPTGPARRDALTAAFYGWA